MEVNPEQLPQDLDTCHQLILQLLDTLAQTQREKDLLRQRLAQLLRARFGPRAEKVDPHQLMLFAQEILAESAAQQAAEPQPQEPAPRKGHGRQKLPSHLPRKQVLHDVPPEERICPCCGKEKQRIGQEISEQLEYVPASLYVIEHVRPKYACKTCDQAGVVTADKPRQPIEKGLPGPGLLAYVITSKYCDHLPLYRLEQIIARYGVHLSRSTLCGWMGPSAGLLEPLYLRMAQDVLESRAIHTDDTPIAVLDRDLPTTRQGRLWAYVGDDLHPYVVYDYTPSRARDGPAEFLGDYDGYLQADAYGAYDGIYANGKVIEVLCWAHARRKFYDARDSDPARSHEALAYIRRLYKVEREAQAAYEAQADGPEARSLSAIRLELRQAQSLEVLDEFEGWLREQTAGCAADGSALAAGPVLPKSPMGIAIQYALGNWQALKRYAADGDLDIDNNAAERAMRPVAIGRKNYLFLGSDNGGRTAAILYSLIATAKRHSLDPFAYLRDVIARISDHPSNRLDELLPDHWKPAPASV